MSKDGGPAFPDPGRAQSEKQRAKLGNPGMSLRDYFAAAALQAIIARSVSDQTAAIPRLNNGFPIDRSAYADTAYQYADAMIQQRDKEQS